MGDPLTVISETGEEWRSIVRPGHQVRLATLADAEPIQAIYAPVVADTALSFEWEAPSVAEMRGRIASVLGRGLPWLVADAGGQVSGYAYASPFRSRAAYAWTAEVSVYVHPEHRGQGVGRALYASLLRLLRLQGFRSAYGFATAPNPGSEGLHRSLGFDEVGRFPRVGYKLGEWHDVVCWRIGLGRDDAAPQRIRPVGDVLEEWRLG